MSVGTCSTTAMPVLGGQPARTFNYDAFDRMVSTTSGSTTTESKYDPAKRDGHTTAGAFGRRIEQKFSNGQRRIYFYDPGGRLLKEYTVGAEYTNYSVSPPWTTIGSPTAVNCYFAGQRVGQWTDRRGDVKHLPGTAQSEVTRYFYPYGEEIGSTTNDQYKFAQLYRDGEAGMDYAMARHYRSSTGRFLTLDPLEEKRRNARVLESLCIRSQRSGEPD